MGAVAYNIKDHIIARENREIAAEIDGRLLAGYLLGIEPGGHLRSPWMEKVDIIVDYMPPYPGKDTRPTLQIRFNDGTEHPPFLRHSGGPLQGFFWDIYGDNFQTVELAILALSQAPVPRYVGPITFTIPLPKLEQQG
jgi:hypothetical protein